MYVCLAKVTPRGVDTKLESTPPVSSGHKGAIAPGGTFSNHIHDGHAMQHLSVIELDMKPRRRHVGGILVANKA